jgi:CRISPR/Cas system-associated exonuclease Cas4 (RecB family)
MSLNEKIEKALEVSQKIEFVMKQESLKRALKKYYGMEYPERDAVAWCALFIKEMLPDIEIFIDDLAIAITAQLRRIGMLHEEYLIKYLIEGINLSLIHEIIHFEGDEMDEEKVRSMTDAVVRALEVDMTWTYIPCPATGGYVTFEMCMDCNDLEKHETCPLLAIRRDAHEGNRQYTLGRYHVSELLKTRNSYYGRRHETVRGWDDYWFMFLGKAIGYFIEGNYPEGSQEFEFEVNLADIVKLLGVEPDPVDEEITILGHADVVDREQRLLLELKTIESTYYVKDRAKPEHIWQTQAYYTLGLVQEPELFERLNGARVVYISRAKPRNKQLLRYKEHEVELETLNFVDAARRLHKALMNEAPPEFDCPKWLCNYCDYGKQCREDQND